MATKKIELIFDLDAKDVQFATDKTLSLTQQIRVLKQELAKGNLGQKEFEIVAAKVGDLEDSIGKATRRSSDFATTLQLIPGPIGEIASKVNGAIALLKQFSGFSFKDLQFQFKETANDIKEIFMNIGSWGQSSEKLVENQKELKDSTSELNLTGAEQIRTNLKAAESTQNLSKALTSQVSVDESIITAQKKYIVGMQNRREVILDEINAQGGFKNASKENVTELGKLNNAILKGQTTLSSLTAAQNTNTTSATKQAVAQGDVAVASKAATVAETQQTVVTKGLTLASNAAGASLRLLRGIMISLGIGVIILGLTTLVTKLYDLATSTKDADKANEKLGETLQQLNRILEDNISLVDEETEVQKIRAQMAGKSEKDITDITIAGIDKRIEVFKAGQKKINREAEKLDALGLTDEQKKTKAKELDDQYVAIQGKVKDLETARRIEVVKGEAAIASETKKIREKNNSDAEKAAAEKLTKDKANLDALIQLEINKKNTDEKLLKDLLAKRLELEELSGAQLLLAQQDNQTKLRESLKEDIQKDLDIRLKSIDSIIENENNAADVDVERVKKLLLHKRDLELIALQNSVDDEKEILEQKKALYSRYEKQIRDIDTKQREDKLIADIAATQGNFDAQIELYRQYAEEAINSEKYTELERVKIIEDANAKIIQLQNDRFQASLTAAQLEYGEKFAYDSDYYDKVRDLYDKEEQNYRNLLATKQIDQVRFDAFMKDSNAARIALDKSELDAKMANFEAVSAIFSASASLVGEQTKAGKALSIASATIDTYVSANKVLADPTPMPTFLRFALAAGAIIRGLASVKKIVDTKLPTPGGDTGGDSTQTTKPQGTINVNARMAQGGMVNGPGSGTSDSIPAMLSNGEYVVNARSTRLFQPLLAAINGYGVNTPAFAAGGLAVQQADAPRMDNTDRLAEAIQVGMANQPIRTYVTAGDITNQQQFDRVIKSRSLI
jgi:hypothetical protein